MLLWLLAGVGLLLATLWLSRAIADADPRLVAFALKSVGAGVLVIASAALVLSGRGAWILGLLPFALPLARRWWHARAGGGAGGAARSGGASVVRSRFFEMHLDHASGDLDGEIREGRHAGRSLSDLSLGELVAMAREIRGIDRESDRLLEAYLDRRDPDRHERSRSDPADGESEEEPDAGAADGGDPAAGRMSPEDAYRVLGLRDGAGEDEIRAAHHRLIASVHPDHGGSSFLAAQVNRARDVLLRGRERHRAE